MEVNSSLVQTVLRWPLPRLRAWLDGLAVGEPVDGKDFNWDVFAFTLAARAQEETSVEWAHLALLVYGVLAQRRSDEAEFSIRLSEMNLRAWMIAEVGQREGDFVLDPAPIVAWVQRLTTMPLEEAARWVAHEDLRAIPIEKLQAMRRLKHALKILAHALPRTNVEQKHPELIPWLQLRARLP
ncbi:hypothetical protein [Corallococcus macrosporus]|uniref:Uncharacterized protein n=1 Tax=Corallococcus macrosporus DSM 14697 TaxID=1189310 RepID=A0A250K3T2_9BACT|nr:hypothetical protein [Corallococcus macrosporus]ATB50560.1 hypothetical protein MYMAC_006216 [Corallococcus macrosporus DSM 14697]